MFNQDDEMMSGSSHMPPPPQQSNYFGMNDPAQLLPWAPVPQAAPLRPMFGCVIPGRDVQINVTINEMNMDINPALRRGTQVALMPIESPSAVADLTFFMIPDSDFYLTHGALIYYYLPSTNAWILLGSLTERKRSAIFNTGWQTKPEVFASMPALNLVIVPTEFSAILQIDDGALTGGRDDRMHLAQKIAEHLHSFMQSFNENEDNASRNNRIVVAPDIFHRWLQKFKTQYSRDPNFLMRSRNV